MPFLLQGSRAAIYKVHYTLLTEQEEAYDRAFQHDPEVDGESYVEGTQEMELQAMWDLDNSMTLRDRLLAPLLAAGVRRGAAALPLAQARGLDGERDAKWGGAGAAWGEDWEPRAEAHARFHARFRCAVRALLLANHRGLPGAQQAPQRAGRAQRACPGAAQACPAPPPRWRRCAAAPRQACPLPSLPAGTAPNGERIHLPFEVLLGIVRGMAAPEAEAAWVPLVGPLPSWIDLNSTM